jgi:UPF0271 protein
MNKNIDINCDMGESYYNRKIGNDEQIMEYISSCNIACGFHGGDPYTISKTIDYALINNVKIGAHPSFNDIKGFGRRILKISNKQLKSEIIYQISAIKGMIESKGGTLNHVKAHGALYNLASKNNDIANIIIESIYEIDKKLLIYGPSMMEWESIAKKYKIKYIKEVFADRNYNDDLTLVNRKNNNSMIEDIDLMIIHLKNIINKGFVETVNKRKIAIKADTVCIHGDQKNALLFAKSIYNEFKNLID